jgi:hypothetical protein
MKSINEKIAIVYDVGRNLQSSFKTPFGYTIFILSWSIQKKFTRHYLWIDTIESIEDYLLLHTNMIVSYNKILKKSFPKEKVYDMTTDTRFGGFLSLLSIINIDKRPRLVVLKRRENEEQDQEKEYSFLLHYLKMLYVMHLNNNSLFCVLINIDHLTEIDQK